MVTRRLVRSGSGAARLAEALEWLDGRPADQPVLVIGANQEAADDIVRRVAGGGRAVFGWHRMTLRRFAARLVVADLAGAGVAPASALTRQAVVARVVHDLAEKEALGRYQNIADRPGLSRALTRTLEELRLAGITPDAPYLWSADLLRVFREVLKGLHAMRLYDTAALLQAAVDRCRRAAPHPLLDLPVLLLDVPVAGTLERQLVSALGERATSLLATIPAGDERSAQRLADALRAKPRDLGATGEGALARVQRHLFHESAESEPAEVGDCLRVMSAPGESRECVEIARTVLEHARQGTRFDQMAVLLRAPEQYRAHLVEALRRAGVPAWFAGGSRQPDPAGRAMLALLACAAEGLSAGRMAEYLSLGEIPAPQADGAPPAAPDASDLALPPDDELLALPPGIQEPAAPEPEAGHVPKPRLWERLLVDAAVIGGRDRWQRRLRALDAELEARIAGLEDPDHPRRAQFERSRRDVRALEAFVLPLIDLLDALPEAAPWGDWIEQLSALATRALRDPERVLRVLAELKPMAEVGPVQLDEVRIVLHERLAELMVRPTGSPAGKLFVGPIDAARGRSFEVVFVPGLAERIFPQKVAEDPILLDSSRKPMAAGLITNEDRVAQERLALHLAVGAASRHLVVSFPRIDLDAGRPRVPSFYGLEVLRAAEGRLPGFEELLRRAEQGHAPRVGWPAPADPRLAIDAAEYDLAWLGSVLQTAAGQRRGAARYLAVTNPHLARALRSRWMRGTRGWKPADGMVAPRPAAKEIMAGQQLDGRSFSPTALQSYSACPYRFYLYTVVRLEPRETAEAVEEMDPLQRGSLVHDAQYDLLTELERDGLLPVTEANLPDARQRLDRVVDRLEVEYRERLAPAIARVWEDGIALIRADLSEWLWRMSLDHTWLPWRFELAFGKFRGDRRDPRSVEEAVQLDCGLKVHGSIDLVERRRVGAQDKPVLRATDTKTGKASVTPGAVIDGGKALQPVLYAMALEKLEAGSRVEGGRLTYCTSRGGFEDREIPLDDRARDAMEHVATVIGGALEHAFFPAAPREARECEWCDYQPVCGTGEFERVQRKSPAELFPLESLRRRD